MSAFGRDLVNREVMCSLADYEKFWYNLNEPTRELIRDDNVFFSRDRGLACSL